MAFIHPLQDLSEDEITQARDVILSLYPGQVIEFRQIGLQEPKKVDLAQFLEAEHQNHDLSSVARPPRLARCHYDTLSSGDKPVQYHETIIDVEKGEVVQKFEIDPDIEPSLTLWVHGQPQYRNSF